MLYSGWFAHQSLPVHHPVVNPVYGIGVRVAVDDDSTALYPVPPSTVVCFVAVVPLTDFWMVIQVPLVQVVYRWLVSSWCRATLQPYRNYVKSIAVVVPLAALSI
uniref:Uncharacterized protein n=1 Tax=Lygus hesperus TaxID=30085 RepID=A0A146KZS1_LYGHE